jgi:ADP-heptose:LPS heptosyltransferase
VTARPRVVVLRALGLGDLMTAVPALRAIRRCNPAAHVTLAIGAGLADLARRVTPIDAVVPAEHLGDCGRLPRSADLAINLHGRGPESTAILRATRPGRLVAFDLPGLPTWDAEEHERARWCRLVGGGDPDDVRVEVGPRWRAPGGRRRTVIMHPGASAVARRWPAVRWTAVASWLRRQGPSVLVTGSNGERELASHVASGAGLPPEAVLAGRTTPIELLSLVAGASLVLSGDTGIAHLAAATGTPSLTLFGPTSPARWGPPAGPHRVLWTGSTGDPHGGTPDPGLLAITVRDVVQVVRPMLRNLPSISRAAAAG